MKRLGHTLTNPSMKAIVLILLAFCGDPSALAAEVTLPLREFVLKDAISYGLEHNLELKAARQRVKAAEAEWIGAKTFPFNPELEGERSSDSRYANEGEETKKLSLTQEVEVFGQRWARKAAAKYRWEAAQSEYKKAERILIAQLREAFINQLFLQKRRQTLEAIAGFDKEIWDSAQKRFKEGMIRQLNLDLAHIEYNRARAEFLRADSEWFSGRLHFNRLLGFTDPLVEIEIKGELKFAPLNLPLEQAIHLALKHRGDYQAAQLEAKASQKDLSLARREVFPNPKLGIFYEREKSSIENLSDDDKLLGFSVGLPLPLLNRNQGGRARAIASRDLANLIKQSLGLDINAQVAQAYRNFKSAEELLELYADLEARLDKDLELVRTAYTQGQIPIEDYLTQKDHLLQAKLDFLDTYKNYSQMRSQLEQAIGLKWEEILSAAEGKVN